MIYKNPIIKGFYPDPSVCFANGKYYLVCSTFQYFPGVALFESEDLVNFKQIGNVLTRKSQVELDKINSSGGVFAPTTRYHDGRFYMVTTNDTTHRNFYVYTDDIYGEWSEPVYVNQGGIDPSLFFEDERTFFISNGTDEKGVSGVCQCEIDIETGEKLSPTKCIWQGSGGRYLESPHMYKIKDNYYLMAAEGGTEYGHMITYCRGKYPWGPFENYPRNPVLTNRNKAPFIIQGIGHGDLIEKDGEWFIISLGFRQMHMWQPYHHLGREVFMTPVKWKDGWFTAGNNGTTDFTHEIKGDFIQNEKTHYTFANTPWDIEWLYLRHPVKENYTLLADKAVLKGSEVTLDEADSPTFIGLRQRDFKMDYEVTVTVDNCEGGVTVYMCENEHYDIAIRKNESGYEAVLKLNIGDIKHMQNCVSLTSDTAKLMIKADNFGYSFSVCDNGNTINLGYASAKYLSSEVSGGFTGVVIGLYAVGKGLATFSELDIKYSESEEC